MERLRKLARALQCAALDTFAPCPPAAGTAGVGRRRGGGGKGGRRYCSWAFAACIYCPFLLDPPAQLPYFQCEWILDRQCSKVHRRHLENCIGIASDLSVCFTISHDRCPGYRVQDILFLLRTALKGGIPPCRNRCGQRKTFHDFVPFGVEDPGEKGVGVEGPSFGFRPEVLEKIFPGDFLPHFFWGASGLGGVLKEGSLLRTILRMAWQPQEKFNCGVALIRWRLNPVGPRPGPAPPRTVDVARRALRHVGELQLLFLDSLLPTLFGAAGDLDAPPSRARDRAAGRLWHSDTPPGCATSPPPAAPRWQVYRQRVAGISGIVTPSSTCTTLDAPHPKKVALERYHEHTSGSCGKALDCTLGQVPFVSLRYFLLATNELTPKGHLPATSSSSRQPRGCFKSQPAFSACWT